MFVLLANAQTEEASTATKGTFDMTAIAGWADWTTTYEKHEVSTTGVPATVVFAGANKQNSGSAIDDCPVTKGKDIEVIMSDGYLLEGVSFTFKQWKTKTQTATLNYSTDGGANYTATETSSSDFTLTSSELPEGTNAVKVTFAESNQVGLSAVEISYKQDPTKVPAPMFSVAGGSYYTAQSVELSAVEGAKIYYSTDGETYNEYTSAINVAADATVYAYAEVEGTKSSTVSQAYVIAKTYTSIADLIATEAAGQPVNLVLNNAKITDIYVTSKGNRNGIYVTDGVDTVEVFAYDVPESWAKDGFVSGTVAGAYKEYKGTKEVCPSNYEGLSYDPAPLFTAGKYYFYNVEAGKYWGAGNSWGTQASLLDNPEYLTLVNVGGKYNIESQVSNGGKNYYFTGSFMDGGAIAVSIALSDTVANTYKIYSGESVYGYDGSTTVLSASATGAAAEWQILSEEEMAAKLATATADNPVNATYLILDPNFGRNNRNVGSWTAVANNKTMSGGNNVNNNAESYRSAFDIYQKINLPAGVYQLDAQAALTEYTVTGADFPVVYAKVDSANVTSSVFNVMAGGENSMSGMSTSFTAGKYYVSPIIFEVAKDTTVTVGVKGTRTDTWCIWDNFTLKYYGAETSATEIALSADLKAYKTAYAEAQAAAADSATVAEAAAHPQSVLATALSNLTPVIETYNSETVLANPTRESLQAATNALNEAANTLKASVETKATLDEMAELLEKTNLYTQETYDAYYTQYYEKYVDGTLTSEEASGLQKPSAQTIWHAAITVDDVLLSVWDATAGAWTPYYINTWSTEGNTDGSEFRVPFFEYWVSDANSLAERTLTATMKVAPGKYDVSSWTRVRVKNGTEEAPAGAPHGIKLVVTGADSVDVCAGAQVGTSQLYLDTFSAVAEVGADSTLTIQYVVEADNNISWLAFKNVMATLIPEAKTDTFEYAFDSYTGNYYEGYTADVDMTTILAELGATSVKDLDIYAVMGDGTLDSNYKLGTTDGWRNAEGNWQSWGASAYYFSKVDFSAKSTQIYAVGGYPGNTNEVATYKAVYALTNKTAGAGEYDTVYVVVALNYVEPAEIEVEFVKTIDVAATETVGETCSGITATFDVNEVIEALGVADLSTDNVSTYIVNTNDSLVVNSTDGWRDADGNAASWGTTKGYCVKLSDPTTGTFDFLGAYDTTYAEGDIFVARWAIVSNADNKAVVLRVTVNFAAPTAIDALEAGKAGAEGIYNIAGQKLNALQKGLNIVDGKKVYVK